MRRIVANFTDRYMNARKHNKQEIVEEAVEIVKNSGGFLARFLKRVGKENYWVEVPKSVACDKVSHALRCLVRKSEAGESLDFLEESSASLSSQDGANSDREEVSSSCLSPTSASPQQAACLASGIKALQQHGSVTSLPNCVNLPVANVLNQVIGCSSPHNSIPNHGQETERQLLDLLLQHRVAQEVAAAKQREQDQEARKVAIVESLIKDAFILDQQQQEQQRRQENEMAGKLTLALLAVAAAGNQ